MQCCESSLLELASATATLYLPNNTLLGEWKTAFVQSLPQDTVGWGSTEFIVMRSIPPVPTEYTYLLARERRFRAHAVQSMTGTSGRQRARTEALAGYPLVFPPADTWGKFGLMAGQVFRRIESNREETTT